MANILHSVTGSKIAQTVETDANGIEHTVERSVPVLREVTFMLDRATPHTLRFLDSGTVVKDGRGVERVVGDAATPYHEFTTAEDAVAAYLDGKV